MRGIDTLGLKLCKYQAELFEASVEQLMCSSRVFVRRFMNSDFAYRLDNEGIIYESTSVENGLVEIEEEYGESRYGSKKFSEEELYWIGYIYRYWSYCYELSSKQLYKIIKPEALRLVYYPYHSLDPQQAVERLRETYLPNERNDVGDIARGVEILKKIRRKYNKA